jgi:beta-galactosidase
VIYCPGNEETLDDDKINVLRRLAALALDYVPDALFNPQEAMRGVEYAFQLAPGEMVQEPFPHNPRRLAALRQFSDLFGAYLLGYVSYSSVKGDWRDFDRGLAIYQRPILTHELGIHGNYLNLDLEHRYAGTRIGNELFDAVRRYLAKMNLLDCSWLYYRNSCAWMRILRKQAVEMARKSKYIAGYDLLDIIGMRTGIRAVIRWGL